MKKILILFLKFIFAYFEILFKGIAYLCSVLGIYKGFLRTFAPAL